LFAIFKCLYFSNHLLRPNHFSSPIFPFLFPPSNIPLTTFL
jgi:hypothetical protein